MWRSPPSHILWRGTLNLFFMVNWESEQEMVRDALAYSKIWPVFMGIYVYDFFLTLWFDWWLISGQIPFRWPYVSYLLGRYSTLVLFIVLITLKGGSYPNGCDARFHVLTIVIVLGNACASFNLAIRTVRIWQSQSIVLGIVTTFILVQWGVLLSGTIKFLRTQFDPQFGCFVIAPHSVQIMLVYSANLLVDVSVLVIGMIGLTRGGSDLRIWRLGDLSRILLTQGMLYFLVTSIVNAFSVVGSLHIRCDRLFNCSLQVFAALNLNTIMDIMLSVPAVVVSTMASCRCVTSLIWLYKVPNDTQCVGGRDQ
ncbi:hypothetical protein NEOLEDRAFT_1138574 [Neolentinus lepideus HHB14362 ss-1]|uniref:Integral membrane protein n=1 Tax=Neolentinus lepideus HHB14362 ss-1 TaxID=1314782 RepID=A0A165Q7I2_9AGAM|nr:hypothetical protein NEOLEDRAFT_1138574 [Neolentinus lepideus HHB14362 ss-1]